jgi:hypothetical protein
LLGSKRHRTLGTDLGLRWINTDVAKVGGGGPISPKSFVCGYCNNPLSGIVGYHAVRTDERGNNSNDILAKIYICHHCEEPTYFSNDGRQVPGSAFGGRVSHIPSKDVEVLYDESRDCMKVNAYTAAVMCSRKLLMNIAVSEGADEGQSFASYVRYLANPVCKFR